MAPTARDAITVFDECMKETRKLILKVMRRDLLPWWQFREWEVRRA